MYPQQDVDPSVANVGAHRIMDAATRTSNDFGAARDTTKQSELSFDAATAAFGSTEKGQMDIKNKRTAAEANMVARYPREAADLIGPFNAEARELAKNMAATQGDLRHAKRVRGAHEMLTAACRSNREAHVRDAAIKTHILPRVAAPPPWISSFLDAQAALAGPRVAPRVLAAAAIPPPPSASAPAPQEPAESDLARQRNFREFWALRQKFPGADLRELRHTCGCHACGCAVPGEANRKN